MPSLKLSSFFEQSKYLIYYKKKISKINVFCYFYFDSVRMTVPQNTLINQVNVLNVFKIAVNALRLVQIVHHVMTNTFYMSFRLFNYKNKLNLKI
jgi:hypothetical protein